MIAPCSRRKIATSHRQAVLPPPVRRSRCLRRVALVAAALALMALSACAARPTLPAGDGDPLDVQTFFAGELKAWGLVRDWRGRVSRQFVAHIDAHWDGDVGVLDELFTFDDGEIQPRIWRLQMTDGDRFIGTADDVAGEATGERVGSAIRWRYRLQVTSGGTTMTVAMDDWLHRVDADTVIAHTRMSKFGLPVGEVVAVIQRSGVAP